MIPKISLRFSQIRRVLLNHIDEAVLISAVAYSYSRTWVHQDDYATGLTQLSPLPYFIFAISMCVVLLKIIKLFREKYFSRVNARYIIALIGCLLISLLYYKYIGDYGLLYACIIGFALQDRDSYYIVRGMGLVALFFFIIQLIGYVAGVFFDMPSEAEGSAWLGESLLYKNKRIAFGFGHPNRAFAFILPVLISTFFFQGKSRIVLAAIDVVLTVIIFAGTGSRTMLLVTAILPIIYYITVRFLSSNRVRIVPMFVFPLCLVISLAISYLFSGTGNPVNELLSGRPQWWGYYVENGVTAFGMTDGVGAVFSSGLPLDNYTLDILYRGGIFLATSVAIWYSIVMYLSFRENKTLIVFAILALFFYGFSEAGIRFVTAPYLPVMMSVVLRASMEKHCARKS